MFYEIVDILGTIAFAISGVLVAMEKRLDLFGILIVAFVTAIGGGTLRDLLIGNTPVIWMRSTVYVITIVATVIVAISFAKKLKYLRTSLFLFDTVGIGLYTLIGVEKGLEIGLSPVICILLGTITACFGGVIRDILCNEIPVIFRKELYATPCILGAASYFLWKLAPLPNSVAYAAAIIVVIGVRLLAVRFKIQLPNIYNEAE